MADLKLAVPTAGKTAAPIVPKNVYEELPVFTYKKTTIDFGKFVEYAKSKELNIFALAIIFIESKEATKGINNNYGGIQADNRRWKYPNFENIITGTCVVIDNTKTNRRFVTFNADTAVKDNYDFMLQKVKDKGINSAKLYYDKWVADDENPPSPFQLAGFTKIMDDIKSKYKI